MNSSDVSPHRIPGLLALASAAVVAILAAPGCSGKGQPYVEPRTPCAARNPLRNVYFGDLHVHTSYSFDAHAFDVGTTPADAYRFARGEAVFLPPVDLEGKGTRTIKIDRPLDFAAVTDHSEFLGEVESCTVPGSTGYDSGTCAAYRKGQNPAVVQFGVQVTTTPPQRSLDVCGEDGKLCAAERASVWARVQEAAEQAYDRSAACEFTSFVGYEYSGAPGLSTLHRNVIFKNARVAEPVSFFEQPEPEGLWRELKAQCLDGGNGCDVLAIPHNSNESNGKMFLVESSGTKQEALARAELRASLEPIVEIYQHKASSECLSGLSGIIGMTDEQCEFERPHRSNFVDCGDGVGAGGISRLGCFSRRDFVRGALIEGLLESERIGVNPLRLGIIASTDTHNGTPGAIDERSFQGHRGMDDDSDEKRLGPGQLTPGGIEFSPGGLAAVWAEENTREAVFDAMRRREVYGTSGPRIAVRVFGGWTLDPAMCSDPELVEHGYAKGVPMGGVLPRSPASGTPRLVVTALRDPGTSTHPSVPLERIQIVKGWISGGERHEQVFDIAGGPTGASVDLATCTPQGAGHDSLCGVFEDPDFDPAARAFYYARVLENPTCRWSTWACNALAPADRPASCSDATPRTIQERAWTSPIWYDP